MKTENDIDQDDLATFIATYPETRRVAVMLLSEENQRWRFVGPIAPQICNEEEIQRRFASKFGGGLYAVKLHDEAGKIIKTKWNIAIADPIDDNDAAERPAAAIAALAPAAPAAFDHVQFLRDELTQNRQLMRDLVNSLSKNTPAQQSSVTELVAALGTLKKLEPPAAATPADTLVKMMELGMKMGKRGTEAGGETEATTWLDLAREVLNEAKPIIKQAIASAQGAPALSAGDDDAAQLAEAIVFLKEKCDDGNTPSLWVAVAMENMDHDVLKQIVAQPFDAFIAVDAELAREPYRTWFTKFQKGVNAALSALPNTGDSEGAGGDQGDIKPNGGAGPASAVASDRAATGAKAARRARAH